jgi:hypothetical protein
VGQVTGSTAADRLGDANAEAFRAFYDLDTVTVRELDNRALAALRLVDAATDLVPANGWSEEELLRQAEEFPRRFPAARATELAADLATSGLGRPEVERMLRMGQLRRHMQVAEAARAGWRPLFDRGADIHRAGQPGIQPDAAINLVALRLSENDVKTYWENEYWEEQRQGFVTRSLFLSPQGQTVRDLLTDDSGRRIGRYVVRRNWDLTAPYGLAAAERARIVAFLHNHGGSVAPLVPQVGDASSRLRTDDYATAVYNAWIDNR